MFRKLVLFFAVCAAPLSAQVCKSNQYDMLDWMAPRSGVQNGNFDVVYPSTGTFYWVKGAQGFPWDVDLFDQGLIYQSITEWAWNDPTTFKRFQIPLPWMPRCIDIPATPGKLSSIPIAAEKTNFDIHSSCAAFVTKNLGYVVSEVWGPYQTTVTGLTDAPGLTLAYRYGCSKDYSSCSDKETFSFEDGVGLVQWTHLVWHGAWVQVNQTTMNQPKAGTVQPQHPCW